jgi:GNAT superfamily N-acetyltransferase
MADFTVRLGTAADIPQFFPFFHKSLHEQFPEYTELTRDYFTDVPYSQENMYLAMQQQSIHMFLAFHKEEVVGYFLAYRQKSGVSMAIWIAVHEDYQHKGLATRLVELWEEEAKKEGAHALQLWTRDKNLPFYKNRGFTLVGKFPKAWYGVDINLLYRIIQEPNEEKYLHGFPEKYEE